MNRDTALEFQENYLVRLDEEIEQSCITSERAARSIRAVLRPEEDMYDEETFEEGTEEMPEQPTTAPWYRATSNRWGDASEWAPTQATCDGVADASWNKCEARQYNWQWTGEGWDEWEWLPVRATNTENQMNPSQTTQPEDYNLQENADGTMALTAEEEQEAKAVAEKAAQKAQIIHRRKLLTDRIAKQQGKKQVTITAEEDAAATRRETAEHEERPAKGHWHFC